MSHISKQNSHKYYRVRTGSDEVEMLMEINGQSLPTKLTGLSMDGVGFFLPKEDAMAMDVGDAVRLDFYDMLSGLKVHVVGVVKEWTEEQNTHLVDVEFSNQASLAEQLGESETWRYFNRRQHFRIHPRKSHFRRCTVALQWRGHEAPHVLHDISAGGLSIRLASKDRLQVPRDRPVRAFLELPQSGEILELTLRMGHEIQAGSHRRVGFALDPVRTPFIAQVEDQLVAAVMEWQRTAIQVASDVVTPDSDQN